MLQLHDLQGNIVAEASDNEVETKLLKTYNSTEFGVPSGKGAPPKYSWLGAEGVARELPSGVITQDGITYVPQTGRPLQTEGVALIAIGNSATLFTRPVEAWVGAQAGEGAARELAKAEQERAEREAVTSRREKNRSRTQAGGAVGNTGRVKAKRPFPSKGRRVKERP